jgi:acid phosphatase family membrane protein YuiD
MIAYSGLEVIFAAFISAFAAQFLKMVFYYSHNKKVNFKVFTETGGMPSSHSSFVVALSTSVGIINGFNSVEFAIALGFAFVVMYDAAGLRRSAGKMAVVLNKIVDEVYSDKTERHTSERLIELLGHTPIEVIMGALLGVVVSFFYHGLLTR